MGFDTKCRARLKTIITIIGIQTLVYVWRFWENRKKKTATFLAFDWGEKRTGVAFGTALLKKAKALPTLHCTGTEERFVRIAELLQTWQPDALVTGLPSHPDGQAHAVGMRARRFARQLHGRTGLCVYLVDERYTSVLSAQNGAADLDAGAAVILLEDFLRSLH